jgi:signal transduction histidine kinase
MEPINTQEWLDGLFLQDSAILLLLGPNGEIIRASDALARLYPSLAPQISIPPHHPPLQPFSVRTVSTSRETQLLQFTPIPLDNLQRGATLLLGSQDSSATTHQDLVDLDTQKNQFLSFLAHEMRSPISSIFSWTELLQSGFLKTAEECTDAYQIIFAESQKLNGYLTKVLNFFRLESGDVPLEPRTFLLQDLLDFCIQSLADLASGKRVTIFIDDDLEKQPIQGDFNLLCIAFTSLLENAILSSPKGSEITLSADHSTHGALFCIQDQGSGIPQELIPVLLKPFHVPPKALRTRTGIGLGLPTANEIILRHGGSLRVEPSPPGTKVFISLPRIS